MSLETALMLAEELALRSAWQEALLSSQEQTQLKLAA